MRAGNDGRPVFLSNNAGGVLGGISSGQPIVARFAVKPTSSILDAAPDHRPRQGENAEIATNGRHDPCVGIRAAPVGEAMMACVLADANAAPSRPDGALRLNSFLLREGEKVAEGRMRGASDKLAAPSMQP